ncbi:hypothetical protein CPBF1521_39200 [Xanthomonas arboricola pv. juglandis]|nr:hypothetical protein CPBF1521_39200 [Xanthomonas arboricola pv. juglandis]
MSPWLIKLTLAASLPSWPLLRKLPVSTCSASLAMRLPRLSSVPVTFAVSALPAIAVPPWSMLAAVMRRSPPLCRLPAFCNAPVVSVTLPSATNTPAATLSMLPACTERSRPAITWLALLKVSVALNTTSPLACATPASASAPVLRRRRSVPASSVPRLSIAAPPSRLIAPTLFSTASRPVAMLLPRRLASLPACAWPFNVTLRCACRSNTDADCRVPPAVRSPPACNVTACALSEPACSRSVPAVACSVVAAATTPCRSIAFWLVSVSAPLTEPSCPLLTMLSAAMARSLPDTSWPAFSNAPVEAIDTASPL